MIPFLFFAWLLPVAFLFHPGASEKEQRVAISSPAGSLPAQIRTHGVTVLPNGRLITPLGRTVRLAPHPFGLVLSHDGSLAVTANSGIAPLSISIVKGPLTSSPMVTQIPPGPSTDRGVLASLFMGLALSPDNRIVYVAGGQQNCIYLFNTMTHARMDSIDCSAPVDGRRYTHGYIGDLLLDAPGNIIFAVDQTNFRVVVVDVEKKAPIASVQVGRYPFGLALAPDGQTLYVANVGMFAYSKIDSIEEKRDFRKALSYPAFPFGSNEMKEGVRRDSLEIPGLGDPNVPESFSVWSVSVGDPRHPVVVRKTKTGVLVGQPVDGIPAVGGSGPNSVVAAAGYVFVSNGNNDNISVIDAARGEVVRTIPLVLHESVRHLRGIIPFGLAASPDGRRLYVAEAGINAVAVIDIPAFNVIGHLPVGWFPSKLCVTADGRKLLVASAKGFGSGPNGGKDYREGPEGTYIGSLMYGTLSILDVPPDSALRAMTERVVENNFHFTGAGELPAARMSNPVPVHAGVRKSPIRHVVFITKENRTYDEVFGQVARGNGDPSIARYGRGRTVTNEAKSVMVKDVTVMPNHLKLASRFAIADNFYVDSDVSADGHRWLANTYPNEWVEANTPATYGGSRSYDPSSKAPGSLGMTQMAGAIYPEDYNEAGSIWEHLERHGVDFFNFGCGTMFEPAFYEDSFKQFGIRYFANYPVPAPMYDRTSRTYATFNLGIPDQYRVTQFEKEFTERWSGPGRKLPPVITLILPNDHGAGERPQAGYPFRESYMADNDLALGRIVEFLSHTDAWKEMAVVVTEDDAQNGVDHVDAHRSVLMVISPYARKDYVSSVHYSFGSIFKTFYSILGIPPLNQYDAGATDLSDMFTAAPDFTPYNAVPSDPRIFDPAKALTPLDEKFDWEGVKNSPLLDDPDDMPVHQKEESGARKTAPAPIPLVRDGKSAYTIVIPAHATAVESLAASEFQSYLRQVSGARLPVVPDSPAAPPARSVLIGRTRLTSSVIPGKTLDTLREDGTALFSSGTMLALCGGAGKGTLYAVYSFLEDELGCRKYSVTVTVVPRRQTILIPSLAIAYNPFFRYREIHYLDAMDREYSDWHKLQSLGDQQKDWGMWVHTFDRLVPAKEFFASHPEYYTLQGGRRIPSGQLCLSNPDVFRILTRRLAAMMAEKPEARYWSVSQNDNANECQCDSCRALNTKFGGTSGTLLDFVNRVAAKFPDKTISTLAYWYTRAAPLHVKPAPNVNIMFCSIECNRSEPIATDPTSASFRKDMEDWCRLTDNILVWDYVVQFRNLVSPFPNLRVLQPNIRYFASHGVRMMFEQGCGANVGEFGALRTYLIAKLLWNPDCDVDGVMDDFLGGYYGAAGKYIRRYIDLMHDALAKSGKQLGIYGYPYDAIDGYLSPSLIREYSRLFDEAERAVRHRPAVLERVKNARLPLEFAILDIALHDPVPELSYLDREGTTWTVRPGMVRRLDAFVRQAKRAGIQRLEEHGTSPDDYRASVEQMLHPVLKGDLAYGRPVVLSTAPSGKYPAHGAASLTDGLRGPNDYHCNWLGFEGESLQATIDLGKEVPVRSVSARFLQDWNSWIWFPLEVDVAVSADGKTFTPVAAVPDTVPDTTAGAFTKDFAAAFAPVRARYVTIAAKSRLTCPDWHIGAGGKSWIFVDEVEVR